MISLSVKVGSTVFSDANDYHSVVCTVFYGNYGAPIVLVLSVILLARFDLMRMVLHCTIDAKHMRLDAGENLQYLS